jgi:hypothetical protein
MTAADLGRFSLVPLGAGVLEELSNDTGFAGKMPFD